MVKDLRQQLVAACKAHEVAHAALKRPGGSHRHCRTLQQPCDNRGIRTASPRCFEPTNNETSRQTSGLATDTLFMKSLRPSRPL